MRSLIGVECVSRPCGSSYSRFSNMWEHFLGGCSRWLLRSMRDQPLGGIAHKEGGRVLHGTMQPFAVLVRPQYDQHPLFIIGREEALHERVTVGSTVSMENDSSGSPFSPSWRCSQMPVVPNGSPPASAISRLSALPDAYGLKNELAGTMQLWRYLAG
jgi:hypothetical protein